MGREVDIDSILEKQVEQDYGAAVKVKRVPGTR